MTNMKLILNGDPLDSTVDDGLIMRSIYSLTGEGDSFAILSKDDMTYIQTAGGPNSGFILEYQDGSLDKHFTCTNQNLTAAQVVNAFQSYTKQDGRWQQEFEWETAGLGTEGGSSSVGTILILLILVIAVVGFIIWKK